MVLIQRAPSACSVSFPFFKTFDGSQAEGRRGSRGLLSVTVGAASSGAERLTSAARPVLADLKAVSAEAEGAVPCHDAAVAAAQLVAGWQQLCGEEEETRRDENYVEDEEAMLWEITFWFEKFCSVESTFSPASDWNFCHIALVSGFFFSFLNIRIVHIRQLHLLNFAWIWQLPMQG